jgi:undecaprenyl diphosphate synthase/isopentenyl-diphosphate delta-isomerase type 1
MKEKIVLLNNMHEPIGTALKLASHHANTPLHLAFSCYVFNSKGEILVTRRASTKKVWPGVWTNSVCGHLMPGESFEKAIKRRLWQELGIHAEQHKFQNILPKYRYETPLFRGIKENELCPVFATRLDETPNPNPSEVEDFGWMSWKDFQLFLKKESKQSSYWTKDQVNNMKNNKTILQMSGMAKNKSVLPRHIGFIVDGNRRWARAKSLTTFEGHQTGFSNLTDIAEYAFKKGVEYVSAYVFSTENWNRNKEEVDYLMKLAEEMALNNLEKLNQQNIRICYLGSKNRISKKLSKIIELVEKKTFYNTSGTLALCFNYGGQTEIIEAVQNVLNSKLKASDINMQKFYEYLYKPELPPLDLVIRSSGEQRLSNFMLWRAAYSELIFSKVHWPDFNETELNKCLAIFAKRQRRFGV